MEWRVYSRHLHRAWDRRRADLSDLAGIDTVLAEIDGLTRDLEQRTAAIARRRNTDIHRCAAWGVMYG